MNAGIYRSINLINNKSYIGQSDDLDRRKKEHLSNFQSDKLQNIIFYKAIRKYGVENFVFEILHYEEDQNKRTELERFYIDTYNTWAHTNSGYNIQDPINPNRYKRKSVIKVDPISFQILEIIESSREAAKKAGVSTAMMSYACLGRGNHFSSDFYWFYLDNYDEDWRPNLTTKPVQQLDQNQKVLKTFVSVSDAGRFVKRGTSDISRACKNHCTCAGYYWQYA